MGDILGMSKKKQSMIFKSPHRNKKIDEHWFVHTPIDDLDEPVGLIQSF
jgi:hypothetical protein